MGMNHFEALAAVALGAFTSSSAFAAPKTTLSAASRQELPSGQVPEGVTAPDWTSIRRQYEQHRHAVSPVAGDPKTLQARNRGQQWRTRFDGRGFVTQPDAGGWEWGLELQSYGFTGCEYNLSAKKPDVRTTGDRVTYDWDATIQEWFVNDKRGLEHGFTIRERPSIRATGAAGNSAKAPSSLRSAGALQDAIATTDNSRLTFTLAVRGSLRPEVEANGSGVRFVDAKGATVINYSGLKVWDADGRVLPSHFTAADTQHPTVLTLSVDERDARYPLTIDPLAQQAYLKASNTESLDQFGSVVAVSGDTVVVGANEEDSNATGVNGNQGDNSATDSGAAYVFVRNGTNWSQQAYIKSSNTDSGDRFGASLALSGDTLIVGAFQEDSNATGVEGNQSDNSATNSGAAYIFVRNGTNWTQQAYLKASNGEANDQFGGSVGIYGDTVVIGAGREDSSATGVNGNQSNNSALDSGAAYVFIRNGTNWTQQAYLKASNTEANDAFGAVAVSDDTIVIGARGESSGATGANGNQSDNSATDSGAAYVFVRNGTNWMQQAYLKASNTEGGDWFGLRLDVSDDTLVVGAYREDSNATGVNGNQSDNSIQDAGAAYVFVRNGTNWSQQAYLKASNTGVPPLGNFFGDGFGVSVAISGNTLVVGAFTEDSNATGVNGNENDNSAVDSGAAYVFVRNGTNWSQQAYVKASNTEAADLFGASVAISGEMIVVGGWYEDSNATTVNGDENDNSAPYSGAAYIFDLNAAPEIVVQQPVGTNLVDNSGTVNFGSVLVGGSSSRTFTITNSGSGNLTGLGITIDGANAGDFTVTANPTSPVIANGSTSFTITFTPTGTHTRAGAIHITSNDSDENPFDIALTGTGTTPLQIAQQAYLKASNTETSDGFGTSVAISGDTVVVGTWFEDSNATGVNGNQSDNSATNSGAAYVFVRNGTNWIQQAYLKASNTETGDAFGYSVGVSGDTVVVGAAGESSNAAGVNGKEADNSAMWAGAAYVFIRNGTNWTQQAYLKASNPEAFDVFGLSVGVSGDTVVVGAWGESSSATGVNGNQSDNSTDNSGATYVFVRSGTNWSQQAYLKASNAEAGDVFGYSVGVSGDTVVVGAHSEDSNATGVNGNQSDNSVHASGAAYIFARSGTNWSQQAYLKASNTSPSHQFGILTAVSGDTVVIGAPYERSGSTGVNGDQTNNLAPSSGAAYVFVRSGTNWSQQAYVKASNPEVNDSFGFAVALSGETLVVGAHGESSNASGIDGNQSDNSASGAGAAYIFARIGTNWSQHAYIKASNTEAFDGFGGSVAVWGDTVVVGASGEDSNATGINGNQNGNSASASGAAYIFDLDTTGAPEIAVQQPAGTNLVDGSGSVDFGNVIVGGNSQRTFTVTNTGNANLTGLGITIDGAHEGDFAVTASPNAPVVTNGSTTFTVTFSPSASCARSAALHIASNDADENPFDITLTGFGADTTPPAINCAANIVASTDPGQCSKSNVTYSVTFNDNCPGGSFTQTAGLPSGSTFPKGITTNRFSATDASGNTNTCSFTVSINDNEVPSISCPGNLVLAANPGQSSRSNVTYSVSSGDNCPGSSLNQTIGLPSGSTFPLGTTTNVFVVTDASGNTNTCSFTVTIFQPPGALQVTISPAGAVTAGAQWQVDGGVFRNSGSAVTNLGAGNHVVSFKFAAGWRTPSNHIVAIISDTTNSVSGIYLPSAGPGPATLFVASQSSNVIQRWQIAPTGAPVPVSGLSDASLDVVSGLTVGSNNELFVVNRGPQGGAAGSVSRFFNPGGLAIFNGVINNGFDTPHGAAFRGDELLVVDSFNNRVRRFTLSGSGALVEVNSITNGLSGARARWVTGGPSNEVFVSECCELNDIRRYLIADGVVTPNGVITGNGISNPQGMTFSSAGEMFVANHDGNSISRFIFSNGVAMANGSINGNNLSGPVALAFSPWGELFAGNYVGSSISRWAFLNNGTAVANGSFAVPTPPVNLTFINSVGGCQFDGWRADSGLLPESAATPWTLANSAAPEIPFLQNGALMLSTSEGGENMYYAQSGAGLNFSRPVVIEARLRIVSGNSSVSYREPIILAFTSAPGVGNGLQIGDELFLLAGAHNIRGQTVTNPSPELFHTYRIEVVTNGNITVFVDGVPMLQGQTFSDLATHGSDLTVYWGEVSSATYSASEWDYVWHNAHTNSCPQGVQLLNPIYYSNNFGFSFNTVNGQSYTVQRNDNLATTNWVLHSNFIGNGLPAQIFAPVPGVPQRFFRVRSP